ncbi:FGGY family carbohydrate kinase, partial [Pseudoxanthobacter sp.]|uniref:FGGY family carbohydrate kinase n=1 Tax=Pseudoxanthobacter sp. TaxID=1925742 RepID=UPI002FDFF01E
MSLPEQSGTKPPLETPEAISPLVLAVDAGGTAVKVVLVDAAGRAEAEQAAEVETHHYADGRVERDADAFWQATARAIRTLLAAHDPARIRAIGCTGFGNGIFLVDADGRPTRPGIVSVDHRGQPLVDALMASGGAAEIARLNGHRPWGGQTVVQLAHLARAEPEVMARTRWGLACKDF